MGLETLPDPSGLLTVGYVHMTKHSKYEKPTEPKEGDSVGEGETTSLALL